MPKADEPPVAVEQVDRDAAANTACHFADYSHHWLREIRVGIRDESVIVQAFARHRIASTPSPTDLPRASEEIERDIRIAIWNAGKWQGKPDEVAQSLIRKAMAEPTMIRALAALSGPAGAGEEMPAEIRRVVDRALAKGSTPISSTDRFAEGVEAAARVSVDLFNEVLRAVSAEMRADSDDVADALIGVAEGNGERREKMIRDICARATAQAEVGQ